MILTPGRAQIHDKNGNAVETTSQQLPFHMNVTVLKSKKNIKLNQKRIGERLADETNAFSLAIDQLSPKK
jgi:hypothetical protein